MYLSSSTMPAAVGFVGVNFDTSVSKSSQIDVMAAGVDMAVGVDAAADVDGIVVLDADVRLALRPILSFKSPMAFS